MTSGSPKILKLLPPGVLYDVCRCNNDIRYNDDDYTYIRAHPRYVPIVTPVHTSYATNGSVEYKVGPGNAKRTTYERNANGITNQRS